LKYRCAADVHLEKSSTQSFMTEVGSVANQVFAVKEIAVYIYLGGLDDGVNGVMTYVGGNTRCVWMSQDMRVADV